MYSENIYKILGSNIRKMRKTRKMTQEDLGNILNVSKTAIVNYEAAQRRIPLEHIVTICNFFNVSVDTLLENELESRLSTNRFFEKWQEKLALDILTEEEMDITIEFAEFLIKKRSC